MFCVSVGDECDGGGAEGKIVDYVSDCNGAECISSLV